MRNAFLGRAGRAIAAVCALAAAAGAAHGEGLRQLEDGWLLQPLEVHEVLDRCGGSAAGGPADAAWLSGGAMRLFGMPELPVRRVAAGGTARWRSVTLHAAFSRETTGADLVAESWNGAAIHLGAESGLGLEFREAGLAVAGRAAGEGRFLHLVLRGAWRRAPWVLRWNYRHPLNRPPGWFGAGAVRPVARLSALACAPGWAAAVSLGRRGDEVLLLSHEISVALSGRLAVGLRFDPATGSLGPVTVWRAGRLMVRTAHVTHPELGITHRCQLVLGVPAEPAP